MRKGWWVSYLLSLRKTVRQHQHLAPSLHGSLHVAAQPLEGSGQRVSVAGCVAEAEGLSAEAAAIGDGRELLLQQDRRLEQKLYSRKGQLMSFHRLPCM